MIHIDNFRINDDEIITGSIFTNGNDVYVAINKEKAVNLLTFDVVPIDEIDNKSTDFEVKIEYNNNNIEDYIKDVDDEHVNKLSRFINGEVCVNTEKNVKFKHILPGTVFKKFSELALKLTDDTYLGLYVVRYEIIHIEANDKIVTIADPNEMFIIIKKK